MLKSQSLWTEQLDPWLNKLQCKCWVDRCWICIGMCIWNKYTNTKPGCTSQLKFCEDWKARYKEEKGYSFIISFLIWCKIFLICLKIFSFLHFMPLCKFFATFPNENMSRISMCKKKNSKKRPFGGNCILCINTKAILCQT